MFNITSPMADFLYNVFNIGLIGGALLVLGSTIGTVWTGGVKERYSNERVAANEAETARANEGAANANRQTAQLRLDLERERMELVKLQASLASRHLTTDQIQSLQEALLATFGLPASVQICYLGSDQESQSYAAEIGQAISGFIHFNMVMTITPDQIAPGITIRGPGSAPLADAFQSASISIIRGTEDASLQPQIFVGSKPSAD